MLISPFYTEFLYTGIVFNHLSKFDNADAVAQTIDTHLENTRHFLNGLAAMDLLIKKNGQYKNTPIVQKFLAEGVPVHIATLSGCWPCPSISLSIERLL